MSILCKLGIHNYRPQGDPTKAFGRKGEFIYKRRFICTRCRQAKLKIVNRIR